MRDAILVEKIIELMSIARVAACQNTHARKFAIATKPAPSHDQRIDDRLAHGGNLPQPAPQLRPREEGEPRLLRPDSRRNEEPRALGARNGAHEITLPPGRQGILRAGRPLDR